MLVVVLSATALTLAGVARPYGQHYARRVVVHSMSAQPGEPAAAAEMPTSGDTVYTGRERAAAALIQATLGLDRGSAASAAGFLPVDSVVQWTHLHLLFQFGISG